MGKSKLNLTYAKNWEKEIGQIQSGISDNLTSFLKKANSINKSIEGEAADGFLDSVQTFVKMAQTYTDSLKNLQNLLDYIAETMKNQ